ncbi:MAG: hypothetical protein ACE5K9_08195 [Candidatus Methylomirabilales bacterium]
MAVDSLETPASGRRVRHANVLLIAAGIIIPLVALFWSGRTHPDDGGQQKGPAALRVLPFEGRPSFLGVRVA